MPICNLCASPDALELPALPNHPDVKRAVCRDCLMTAALVFSVHEKQHPPEWYGEMNVPLSNDELLADFGAIEQSFQTGQSIPSIGLSALPRGSHLRLVTKL